MGEHHAARQRLAPQNRESFTLGRKCASPSHTRGGSRMGESRSYRSVRGAISNERPYRELETIYKGAELLYGLSIIF
jgi:hypothetical protein